MASFTSNAKATGTSAGGSYTSAGAPDLSLHYFVSPTVSIEGGIDLYSNKTTGNLDAWGARLTSRFYFYGNGIAEVNKSYELKSSNLSKWAFYAGPELKRYNYFLGSNPEVVKNYEAHGTYFNINALIGVDYRFNSHWEGNFEVNNTFA